MQRLLVLPRLQPTRLSARGARCALNSLYAVYYVLQRWQQNAKTRRQLAFLSDRELADIGLTKTEQQCELNKPFWR
ncbi:DUF1127 domain-containing protein [Pseudomonas asuensis]|jgi:uncharacterized protein YjiS (DUF1127 family)|uniref:YjiS-like domain-containing protein n=1 Tax=Pseudomonas asuensis TaxID=1825787 RepID=A0ABQ2H103_9PSED|nr:DUF1127 domain-containing protein [Pseudomonas asuensis]GGM21248.1 hypothetical protein GCM10009425_35250 [Pseudomonas asuensis]